MTTLPTYTRTIDNAFVTTWYEIRPEAVDNILLATPIWAALQPSMESQVGGEYITRTVKYANRSSVGIAKGDVLPQGEVELETMARWDWRHLATHIQRSLIDDQKNNGKSKIKSYVAMNIQDARDSLVQKLETQIMAAETTDESGKEFQSLYDIVPTFANRATGTYGAINRSNSWWQPKYKQWTSPRAVNLLKDMKNLYNTCGLNQEYPNLIVTDQTTFELYEDFALDASQIIKDESTRLADLGFEVLRFKGKPMVWTPNVQTAGDMMFLNTNYIDIVYDPNLWFDMTEWKSPPDQLERLAHIVSAINVVSDQLRRHGLLYI